VRVDKRQKKRALYASIGTQVWPLSRVDKKWGLDVFEGVICSIEYVVSPPLEFLCKLLTGGRDSTLWRVD
jgi:hypothetical protein